MEPVIRRQRYSGRHYEHLSHHGYATHQSVWVKEIEQGDIEQQNQMEVMLSLPGKLLDISSYDGAEIDVVWNGHQFYGTVTPQTVSDIL